jgi:glycosyltransferase involved in cell wall biosynthesis
MSPARGGAERRRASAALVIPAYNAAATLAGVLDRIPPELPLRAIVIVNDGSRDQTGRVAAARCAVDPRCRVRELPRNRGYGGAMKEGLRAAREEGCSPVACVHADGQYAPELLPELLAALERRGLDLLQGSRIASGTALSGGMPRYKYVAGLALTALENRVLRLGLTDYHSGYLLYGRRALEQIPFDRLSDSFDFDLEVLACARALGLSVGEEPVPTRYAGEVSYLRPIPYGMRVLRVLGRYIAGRYRSR